MWIMKMMPCSTMVRWMVSFPVFPGVFESIVNIATIDFEYLYGLPIVKIVASNY